MPINYSERIPNNVNLTDDRRLQRALEAWQPGFLQWWSEMGPENFQGGRRSRLTRRGGRISDTSRCRTIGGGFFSPIPNSSA